MIKYLEKRPAATLDIECYKNYFLVKFRDRQTGRTVETMLFNGEHELDKKRIATILRNFRIYTFNGNSYDMLLLAYAMAGATEAELKLASDRIIVGKMRSWQFTDMYGVGLPSYVDHIDLMDVAPGQATLKMYGGRVHSKYLQDLPVHHTALIKENQLPLMSHYCGNDLILTGNLIDALIVELEMREFMSDLYGIDLRSKSDAQIAEAVIKRQAEKLTGKKIYKPTIDPGWSFNYVPPRYLKFQTEVMQTRFQKILRQKFYVGYDGKVVPPDLFKELIHIGNCKYKMGIGGLHSTEKSITHFSTATRKLIDTDATSYYPWLMINCGFSPRSIGVHFKPILKDHVIQRMIAKDAGKKKEAHSRKIIVNAIFGKTGSPTSIFYAPDLMIAVTLTGQLSLLMLIEEFELNDIEVVSANTDGVVALVDDHQMDQFRACVTDWEWATGMRTEENRYLSLHSRDVNNYFAREATYNKSTKKWLDVQSGIKAKGAYANEGLQKNPTNEICLIAIKKYLEEGTSINDTIKGCTDIRKFTTLRQVAGGAAKGDEILGKTVRWYYSTNSPGPIVTLAKGDTVPRSTRGKPCLDLPDRLPDDIDYNWYIRETYHQLKLIGVDAGKPVLDGVEYTFGFVRVKAPTTKSIHWLDKLDHQTLCGYQMKNVHDLWNEYEVMPDGYRMCSKCRKIWEEEL